MPSNDPRIDAYIAKAQPFAQPILKHIRKTVHAACPAVQETMKWGFPHFDYKGMMCSMAAFKEHVAFGFWKGELLENEGLPEVEEKAMGSFGRITSIKDLPAARTLTTLIKAAAALNDKGVRVARTSSAPKGPVRVPAYFLTALRRHKTAKANFDAFSPSKQRDYIDWIVEAKGEATREKRMAISIEWIAEGKARNWKYER
jgi:hypothetical protein